METSPPSQGELSIEQYLSAANLYRATSYPDLFAFPIYTVPLSDQTIVITHHSELLQLLAVHGFSSEPQIILESITKPYYPGGDIEVKALRILYHTDQSTLGCFSSARDSVREFLISQGHHDLHVEIVHQHLCFQPSFFAIDPHNWAVRVYERARNTLLSVIDDRLGSAWRLLCLFAVARTEDQSRPSIVVLVEPGTICDWATLEGSMREVIARNSPGFSHLDIEFLPGTLDEYTSEPPPEEGEPGVHQLDSIMSDGKLEMGFSIGRRGERGGGTAGGFVTLTQDGVTRNGILTNYHVVRPRSESEASATVSTADSPGSSFLSADEGQHEIQVFMGKDIDATREYMANSIQQMESSLKELQESRDRTLMIGRKPHSGLSERISAYQDHIKQYQFKESIIQQMPIPLGKVIVSSPKLIYERRIHDWDFCRALRCDVCKNTSTQQDAKDSTCA